MLHLALAATIAAFQGVGAGGRPPLPSQPADPSDTLALMKRAWDAEVNLFAIWSQAWRARTKPLTGRDAYVHNPRMPDQSCTLDVRLYTPDHAIGLPPKVRRIASANGHLGICPNWVPPKGFPGWTEFADERVGIDGALDAKTRPAVTQARLRTIALLDSASQAMPGNTFVIGQLVRLLVDQRNLNRALEVARGCKAAEWWCNALTGYVLHERRDVRGAQYAFANSAGWLVEQDRCTWTDVSALLDSAARAQYSAMSCADRLAFNDTFWWMVDPLWSEPGNDRFTEQVSRQMIATLHSAMIRDERYNWLPTHGGDALDLAVRRYGWPSYVEYGLPVKLGLPPTRSPADSAKTAKSSAVNVKGDEERSPANAALAAEIRDKRGVKADVYMQGGFSENRISFFEFANALASGCSISPPSPPVCIGNGIGPIYEPEGADVIPPLGLPNSRTIGSTFEYSLGRIHAVPTWTALMNPFGARDSDWAMNAPIDTSSVMDWWPNEHYGPRKPIMQFDGYQSATLRRERDVLLAAATNLGLTQLARKKTDTVSVQLLVSPGPDSILRVGTVRASAADRAVFLEAVPSRPLVASLEIPWGTDDKPAGRARFGVIAPQPLLAMQRGEVGISDPILVLPPTGSRALPNDADEAIPLMLGSTSLSSGTTNVGVYWETYGFAATDTVEVTLRIQKYTPGAALKDDDAPVRFSWREPDPTHATRTIAGNVPIQMRSLAIEISSLDAGDYALSVSVGRLGQTPVRSVRQFRIRK